MRNVRELLEHQATWQKARAALPWPEKIRQAEILRDTLLAMRRSKPEGIQGTHSASDASRSPIKQ